MTFLFKYICICVCVCIYIYIYISFSCVRLFATPEIIAHQSSLSMGFYREEYWSGLPFPPPGDLPDPGIDSLLLSHLGSPNINKCVCMYVCACVCVYIYIFIGVYIHMNI